MIAIVYTIVPVGNTIVAILYTMATNGNTIAAVGNTMVVILYTLPLVGNTTGDILYSMAINENTIMAIGNTMVVILYRCTPVGNTIGAIVYRMATKGYTIAAVGNTMGAIVYTMATVGNRISGFGAGTRTARPLVSRGVQQVTTRPSMRRKMPLARRSTSRSNSPVLPLHGKALCLHAEAALNTQRVAPLCKIGHVQNQPVGAAHHGHFLHHRSPSIQHGDGGTSLP